MMRAALHRAEKAKPEYLHKRVNRTFRDELLDVYLFGSLRQIPEIARHWVMEYNEELSHDSSERVPPVMFRRQVENARIYFLELWLMGEASGMTRAAVCCRSEGEESA
jgi:putative transposase